MRGFARLWAESITRLSLLIEGQLMSRGLLPKKRRH